MLASKLKPFFTAEFLKFCSVGASGVVVNLGFLALFSEAMGIRSSVASALAIEISILSNFLINEHWTFRGARAGRLWTRGLRFQLISLIGALMQWGIFLAMNLAWLWLILGGLEAYLADGAPWLKLVREPPEVGRWVYASQLIGIGAATAWNFLANFYWTWRRGVDGA